MEKTKYSEPVSTLLTYKKLSFNGAKWPGYLKLGFSKEHIPELITMIGDESLHQAKSDSMEVWAPVHAWRILGQLQAVEAIPALLDLLEKDDDDWVSEELPKVFTMIGTPAIPELIHYLGDLQHSTFARVSAANSLANIGKQYPETRDSCIKILEEQLKLYRNNDPALNGLLVCYLVDLEAVETLPTIQQAYRDDCVDLVVMGDCEDVEIELGVRNFRSTPRPPLWPDVEGLDQLRSLMGISPKQTNISAGKKPGRNDPCPCGSGKKYKKCCMGKEKTGFKKPEDDSIPRCGLCGKTTNLTKTPCCDQWICDDEPNYILGSLERNSCYRNHMRYTLCGNHYTEGHSGHWKDCEECKEGIETELYVYYGTNEYNFEKLENPSEVRT